MKKKYTYLIISIVIGILLILTLILSPLFDIKQIDFKGLNRIDKNQLIRDLQLDKKNNILAFNNLKARKILKNNYYINEFKITKKLPNTLIIEIKERDLAGYIPYINDYLYIDKNGFVVDVKSNFTEKLPLIIGLEFDRFVLGKTLSVDNEEAFTILTRFTNALDGKDINADIFKIDVSDLKDIHLYIGNIDALLGDGSDINVKINTLIEIIKNIDINEKGFLYIQDINTQPIFQLLT